MMRTLSLIVVALATALHCTASEVKPQPLATGLGAPLAITVGGDGNIYVASALEKENAILKIVDGKGVTIAKGLETPFGLVAFQKWLFAIVEGKGIWKIDLKGKSEIFAPANAFRSQPSGLTVDPDSGVLYTSSHGKAPAVYRVDPKGKVSVIFDGQRWPDVGGEAASCLALAMDGASHLIMGLSNRGAGELYRLRIADKSLEKLADGLTTPRSLTWDMYGRLFIGCSKNLGFDALGQIFVIPRPGMTPIPLKETFGSSSISMCLDPTRRSLLVASVAHGTIHAIPAQVPGQPVDETPLPLETAVAFPDLKWTGWQGETDVGKINPLRPIVLTHAGDGSNRVFVATQHGVIHVFPNDQTAKETKVFLDIEKQVRYQDKENEEGFLGLTFHPDYKKTGEFFVFYTPKNQKLVNVVSRFRVSKDDPDKADRASEEIIYTIKRPFWNHDGGTICFGPDGYLYIAIGDGGAANDPFNNAQNLKTPLGDILRIDINKKDPGKNYAVPPDNPFVGKQDALPEIWAYGLRNVWRMAFDRKTGQLWAGEVGQNLYEEINIIVKGGNYGWKLRESLHPFGANGVGVRPDLIEPIWEYHHDIGKSITGGHVYRGKNLPELEGHYLYGDYVSNKIWALRYDDKEKRVVANRPIRDKGQPILSFGEDEVGEAYLLTYSAAGRGIYHFVRTKK